MKLSLKQTVLAVALVVAGAANAAPSMQICTPMEVLQDSRNGLTYNLRCAVGDWDLNYIGAIPAGTGPVLINYKLTAKGKDGSNFSKERQSRLASPSHLGQTLLREAVQLDDGQLALRDCTDINCSKYRAIGDGSKLAKATVTVTPELAQLREAHVQLSARLSETEAELASRTANVRSLELEISGLSTLLSNATAENSALTEAHRKALAAIKSDQDNELSKMQAQLVEQASLLESAHGKTAGLQANLARAEASQTATSMQASDVKPNIEVTELQSKLEAAVADRDNALEAVQILTAEAVQMISELQALGAAYQTVRDEGLKLVDELTKVSAELNAATAELDRTKLALTMAETKTQAATLARDLSMQAADVAHLDANTMHLNIQALEQTLKKRDNEILALKGELQGVEIAKKADKQTSEISGASAPTEAAFSRTGDVANSGQAVSSAPVAQDVLSEQKKSTELQKELDALLPELYALRWRAEKETLTESGKPLPTRIEIR